MNDWFGYMPPGMGPMESGGAGSPMPQSGRAPRFGGVLQRVGRALTPERLQGLAAILQDLNGGQGHFDRFQAGQAEHRQQAAEQERQARFREAYAASVGPDGQIDPALLQRNLAPYVNDIGDLGALNSATNRPKPSRYNMNGTLIEEGDDGQFHPTFGLEYVPGPDGSWVRNPNAPQRQQAPNGPPAVGARIRNPNDPNAPAMVWDGSRWAPETSPRPTSAAPLGAAAPQGNVNYSAPFSMAPSSPFGPRTPPKTRGGRGSRNHGGIDYPVGIGTAVPSAADGEVIFAGPLGGYGNTVKVRHPDGSVTQYSHLRSPSVRVGDSVTAGAPVGESGDSGNVSGPHLHFGAYDAQGRPFDPASRYRR